MKKKSGFALVEAVLAISIVSAFIITVAAVNVIYTQASISQEFPSEASFIIEESVEAARFMRDNSWTYKIGNQGSSPRYLAFFGSNWQATSSPAYAYVGNFFRTVTFQDVYRGANDQIVLSGGTLDPNIKKVLVSVSWIGKTGTSTKTSEFLIANLFDN